MAPLPTMAYKKNFRCKPALQLFYTGGPVKLSKDGECVFCACADAVKVVDLDSGAVRTTLEGDSEPITALAVAPDGSSLFTASRSLSIKLWNVEAATCERTWKGHEAPISDMVVNALGTYLATGSADRSILVWDVEQGYCTHAFRGHKGVVTTVLFHPDPQRLLLFSGSDDATVRVWDLMTKKCVVVLEKHFSTITSFAVSSDGQSLLSAARDKVVNVWNLRNNSLHVTVPVYEAVESICIVPAKFQHVDLLPKKKQIMKKKKQNDSAPIRFLTVGDRSIIRIWLLEGAVCLYEQKSLGAVLVSDKEEARRGFTGAVLMPQGRGLMCITADQRLLFYESIEDEEGNFDMKISKRLIGYNEEVIDLKFLGEQQKHLAVATNQEHVHIYDITTMACTLELFGHNDIVLCLDTCLSLLGTAILASGSKDHTVRIWNSHDGTCLAIGDGHMAAVGAVAFSRKHKKFLISASSDCTIKVWSLDGILDGSDLGGPRKLSSFSAVAAHDKDINSVAVAPNDSFVCSGSQDRTACVWRLPELVPFLRLRGHKRGIWCVEFSPVDQCVMTASGDKTVRIWSLSDGSCLKVFEGHTASVLRATFLTRGTQLVSTGADGLVKLWTVKTNECVNTFDKHEDKIWALAVSQKNEMLATGGSDSAIYMWEDCTLADAEETLRKEEEEILKDQDLANAIADTDYVTALQIAFELRRSFKLLNVLREMLKREVSEEQLRLFLKGLGKEHLHLLLEYLREWNAKPKFCHVAQCILHHIFCIFPPKRIIEVPGIREVLEGIIPYTQRHLSRVDRLLRSTFLLEYTLSAMSVLDPSSNEGIYLDRSRNTHVEVKSSVSDTQPLESVHILHLNDGAKSLDELYDVKLEPQGESPRVRALEYNNDCSCPEENNKGERLEAVSLQKPQKQSVDILSGFEYQKLGQCLQKRKRKVEDSERGKKGS